LSKNSKTLIFILTSISTDDNAQIEDSSSSFPQLHTEGDHQDEMQVDISENKQENKTITSETKKRKKEKINN
jgi:hypothetical protein